ncbi:alpha-hydroxy acid oxidase [Novosphingobium sp.]|uniref:alpha-hydroxy acid oxidase n=1 Tax=Novosphingobium sp. TaxID=1874826 RepID=UPI0022C724A2|nr:alpha-hydroxy acid oxidase [Novosphingobium sp.]MCZ8017832.1 alpha-hydroxy acid oxidase [Novosphingobium sp.]MCZ8033644.1 alpha-hydroxy acid oxidase [Novosphingobium sp.]MCZ8051000.1 alpha-hydroxy acid oxidase [Novosphingobium sp.]MCZ8059346.1 alpha-hydroxy acid oxidase [Novosphingobium sp.]MCZ8231184.1 alpha-hydroxy acid oxidase [Novosphingobium sp.]
MRLTDCHNIADFRELARRRLPWPVFDYIDGAADDEVTKVRNTSAFDQADLVPDVLAGVAEIDTSITLMGRKSTLPLMLSPTALQRVFHWQGERAVAKAAEKHGLWFGISSLATVSIEETAALTKGPKLFQLYVHKDKGLNRSMIERCQAAQFDCIALTVDTIVSGKRERCARSGFTSPPKFTARNLLGYAMKPRWGLDYLLREKFSLPNLDTHVVEGTGEAVSIAGYFNTMLDQSMDWHTAADIRAQWGGTFCLKGVMSAADARRAVEIGADAIMISNHGGRQLDGSRAPFDQLREIVDAVGGEIEIICDGGVRRGTHVLKSLCAGATAASGGRLYLYALAAAGQDGVERAIMLLKDEIERGMKLMGVTRVDQLTPDRLRWR